MFDLSPEKILVLGVIAVIFLGPDRLPNAARSLAKLLHQFRTVSGSLQAEMREVLAEPRQVISDAVGDLGLPTDIGLPRMPTPRSLVSQVLGPPTADSRVVETSANNGSATNTSSNSGSSVEATRPGPPPDDPSLN